MDQRVATGQRSTSPQTRNQASRLVDSVSLGSEEQPATVFHPNLQGNASKPLGAQLDSLHDISEKQQSQLLETCTSCEESVEASAAAEALAMEIMVAVERSEAHARQCEARIQDSLAAQAACEADLKQQRQVAEAARAQAESLDAQVVRLAGEVVAGERQVEEVRGGLAAEEARAGLAEHQLARAQLRLQREIEQRQTTIESLLNIHDMDQEQVGQQRAACAAQAAQLRAALARLHAKELRVAELEAQLAAQEDELSQLQQQLQQLQQAFAESAALLHLPAEDSTTQTDVGEPPGSQDLNSPHGDLGEPVQWQVEAQRQWEQICMLDARAKLLESLLRDLLGPIWAVQPASLPSPTMSNRRCSSGQDDGPVSRIPGPDGRLNRSLRSSFAMCDAGTHCTGKENHAPGLHLCRGANSTGMELADRHLFNLLDQDGDGRVGCEDVREWYLSHAVRWRLFGNEDLPAFEEVWSQVWDMVQPSVPSPDNKGWTLAALRRSRLGAGPRPAWTWLKTTGHVVRAPYRPGCCNRIPWVCASMRLSRLGNEPRTCCRTTTTLGRTRRRRPPTTTWASAKRQPKDPSKYSSIEDLRAELQNKQGLAAGLSGFLNWLGDAAFGRTIAPQGHLDIASCYRWALQTRWAQGLTSKLHTRPGYVPTQADLADKEGSWAEAELAAQDLDPVSMRQLQAVMLCSQTAMLAVARRYPPVLDMAPQEVLQRLLCLKGLLPGCDAAGMVELQPRLFLEPAASAMEASVRASLRQLHQGLPGADVNQMVQEDPSILFEEAGSLAAGLHRLHELWDLDTQALSNSDPAELVLAVRALSDAGLPRTF
ncbi:hypothetical protein WJX72_012238 [[Myrmecia] bisecta]|uniref:EF-hand domain-containing protein n=1 Tax=[Myrmecia] bisecta TaxID=41462 RepID=A0AAW1PQX1_9CHLO